MFSNNEFKKDNEDIIVNLTFCENTISFKYEKLIVVYLFLKAIH